MRVVSHSTRKVINDHNDHILKGILNSRVLNNVVTTPYLDLIRQH